MSRVLVMAGGTGGHVFPALAIVKELQNHGHEVEWLGTRGRIEEKLIPNEGIPIHYIDVKGVRRNGLISKLKAPFMVVHAILQARKVLKTFKPDVVIGFGGYASGPGGMAAYLSGIPLILHEQNAAAGLTNRILSKFARKILLGVGQAFVGPNVQSVGNPVRKPIMDLNALERNYDHIGKEPTRILILGGSLGAKALNENVPLALMTFGANDIKVLHQCGKDQSAATAKLYERAPFEVTTSDFVEDMATAYNNADLIICRAGASTISEVCACKLPAIFVPLPTAVDDHQTKNALSLVEHGAAKIIPQKDLTKDSLSSTLREINNKDILLKMSHEVGKLAKLDATTDVVKVIEELSSKK